MGQIKCVWGSDKLKTSKGVQAITCGRMRSANYERGSTLIEFAFVAVLLFTIFFGIIDFGRALYAYHFVASAAREATRFAMVRGATWPTACVDTTSFSGDCQANNDNVQFYVQTMASGIGLNDASSITASLTPLPPPNGSGTNCSSAPINPGCTAQVTVQYPFKFIFPLMPTSTCTVNQVTASICMTSTSEMVVSQ